jgi:hypothetical protein
LFDTVPQDVSLTVRTVIAEDVLIKENLFGAPVAKSEIPDDLFGTAVFTAIATDGSGDVWAIGSLESPIILRLNPEGGQRWGAMLEPESGLTLHGVHAPGDGTVYVAGEENKAPWIARFDAQGALLWEFRLDAASATSAVALSTRGDGTVVCGMRCREDSGGFALQLVELDERGRLLGWNPVVLPLAEGDRAQIAVDDDAVLAIVGSDGAPSEISRLATGEDSWMSIGAVPGGPIGISGGYDPHGIVCAVEEGDSSQVVRLENSGAGETLLEVRSELVTISARDARHEVIWLYRAEGDRSWKVGRDYIGNQERLTFRKLP